MKHILTGCLALLLCVGAATAQKELIEQKDYDWSHLPEGYHLTNDGKYMTYEIPHTGIVASVDGKWEKRMAGIAARDIHFTWDNKLAIAPLPGDSLLLLSLGSGAERYVSGVASFKVSPLERGEWIASLGNDSNLVLEDLSGKQRETYTAVKDFQFSQDGAELVCNGRDGLFEVDVPTGKVQTVWSGQDYGQVVVDPGGNHIAFLSHGSIGYWKKGMDGAELHPVNASDAPLDFGLDGRQVLFSVKAPPPPPAPAAAAGNVNVDIWTFKDATLPVTMDHPDNFPAVWNADGDKVFQLAGEYEHLDNSGRDKGVVLVNREPGNNFERYWNPAARTSVKLVSTIDGSVIHEFKAKAFFNFVELSWGRKYAVLFDYEKNNYVSYDIATGETVNISKDIPTPLLDEENEMTAQPAFSYGIAGWLEGDKGVLIYDRYDIWLVDPTGKERPVDITNGYGRRHHVKFHLIRDWSDHTPLKLGETLMFTAFNDDTKDNGFWKGRLEEGQDPREFVKMEACYYCFPGCFIGESGMPVKARDAEVYLTQRQTASSAPNLYLITPQGSTKQLTDLQPQKGYNWMTSELVTWTLYDGTTSRGILYKPENFDPNKKYPLVFYYYMNRLSNGLNQFKYPEMTVMLNVPYYTSHGYLVFIPDIHFTKSEPGPCAYNAVGSAADYLGSLPYVDAKKMGISGHSYGGYETNYLVTATTKFAAASSGAGISDLVSIYGSGSGQMMHCEIAQFAIGFSLYQRPDLYIENSPVFRSNLVQTPLLIMHNKGDNVVPFGQDLEYFMALRRQGKPVWLLQYDNGGHTLGDEDATDFCIRQAQFFNHFLKGEAPPKWMTQGIPQRMKGIDNGLELMKAQ